MTPDAIEEAARLLAANRLEHARLTALPEGCRPPDIDAAYVVQERLNEKLSLAGLGRIAGWKIGVTTPVMQRYMGMYEPSYGAVFAPIIRHGHATVRHADFANPGVEAEIAVSMAKDLPLSDTKWTRDSVADAVGACMASIEIVDARYADYRKLDTPTMVADDFFNAGVILGPARRDWRALDLAAVAGRMVLNGKEVGSGTGALVMGHPFEALAFLANRLAGHGRFVRAGDIVTLGSIVETRWLAQGDVVEVTMDGIGSCGVTFA